MGTFRRRDEERMQFPLSPTSEVRGEHRESDGSMRQLEFGAAKEAAKSRRTTCWKWAK